MGGKRFSATVPSWIAETKERQTACLRLSAQKLVRRSTETSPIKTGNLRRSLMASTSAMPVVRPGVTFAEGSETALTIAGLEIGTTLYLGYQAAYAWRLENGFVGQDSLGRTYNQPGRFWVQAQADQWPAIVAEAAQELMR